MRRPTNRPSNDACADAINSLVEELDVELRRDKIVAILNDLKGRRANQSDLDAFASCDLQCLSYVDAAAWRDKSLGAIYAALSRGRKKVSDELTRRMLPDLRLVPSTERAFKTRSPAHREVQN